MAAIGLRASVGTEEADGYEEFGADWEAKVRTVIAAFVDASEKFPRDVAELFPLRNRGPESGGRERE